MTNFSRRPAVHAIVIPNPRSGLFTVELLGQQAGGMLGLWGPRGSGGAPLVSISDLPVSDMLAAAVRPLVVAGHAVGETLATVGSALLEGLSDTGGAVKSLGPLVSALTAHLWAFYLSLGPVLGPAAVAVLALALAAALYAGLAGGGEEIPWQFAGVVRLQDDKPVPFLEESKKEEDGYYTRTGAWVEEVGAFYVPARFMNKGISTITTQWADLEHLYRHILELKNVAVVFDTRPPTLMVTRMELSADKQKDGKLVKLGCKKSKPPPRIWCRLYPNPVTKANEKFMVHYPIELEKDPEKLLSVQNVIEGW